ncbi:CoA transferase [Streptomyces sp. OE57]|uniref:CoA transferase n=1 Tax=Streptomyces lacaronensis TaxID=3379885 RepID=UPI0039B74A4C
MPYSDRNWRNFFTLIGREELGADPRFATNGARHVHMNDLQLVVAEVAPQRTVAEWLKACRDRGIPAQKVLDLDRLDESEYLTRRDFLQHRTHPTEGEYLGIRFPVDFSRTPADTSGPAPAPVNTTTAPENRQRPHSFAGWRPVYRGRSPRPVSGTSPTSCRRLSSFGHMAIPRNARCTRRALNSDLTGSITRTRPSGV